MVGKRYMSILDQNFSKAVDFSAEIALQQLSNGPSVNR